MGLKQIFILDSPKVLDLKQFPSSQNDEVRGIEEINRDSLYNFHRALGSVLFSVEVYRVLG